MTIDNNNNIHEGEFLLGKDFKPNIQKIEDEKIVKSIASQLFEVCIHRVKREFKSVHSENKFNLIKNSESGIEMSVSGKNQGDKYRVKNNSIIFVDPSNNKKTDVQVKTKLQSKLNNTNKDVEISPKPLPKPEPDMSLASIYKDLRNEQSNNVIDKNAKEIKDEKKKTNITSEKEIESKNSELSISELDLVLQQLRGCFNPQAGTIIEKDEMVVITAQIDRNARVKTNTIQISDTNISINNPFYKSITESAMRTLYNPACSILKLPKEKYDNWKKLTIKFDYSWITK